jgi:hypothetical protein
MRNTTRPSTAQTLKTRHTWSASARLDIICICWYYDVRRGRAVRSTNSPLPLLAAQTPARPHRHQKPAQLKPHGVSPSFSQHTPGAVGTLDNMNCHSKNNTSALGDASRFIQHVPQAHMHINCPSGQPAQPRSHVFGRLYMPGRCWRR